MDDHESKRIRFGLLYPFYSNSWWINRTPWLHFLSTLPSAGPSSSLLVVSASQNRNALMFSSGFSSYRLVLASPSSSILRKWKFGTPSNRSSGVFFQLQYSIVWLRRCHVGLGWGINTNISSALSFGSNCMLRRYYPLIFRHIDGQGIRRVAPLFFSSELMWMIPPPLGQIPLPRSYLLVVVSASGWINCSPFLTPHLALHETMISPPGRCFKTSVGSVRRIVHDPPCRAESLQGNAPRRASAPWWCGCS